MASKIKTRKDDVVEELHEWLVAQSSAASDYFSALPIRDKLRDELKSLATYEYQRVPIPRENRYFYMKRKAGEDLPALYVREGLNGEERLLLDPNTLTPDKTTTLAQWRVSPNGKWIAYGLSKSGNDKGEMHVLNVDTGETLMDVIPDDVYPSLDCWNFENSGFWYRRHDPDAPADEPKFHKRTYFHRIGTDSSEDEYVWGKGFGREWMPEVSQSRDGKYMVGMIHGQEHGENWVEVYIKESSAKEFTLVLPRVPGSYAEAHMHRDKLYVYTNDGAPNWKLMATSIETARTGKPEFVEILPESSDVLESFRLTNDYLFVAYIRNATSVLKQYKLDGTFVRDIELPTLGSVGLLAAESDGKELFYVFDSFAYPPVIFRLDFATGEISKFYETKSTYDTNLVTTEQVWYTSKDGTSYPATLVMTSDGDDRVHPLHAYKFTARLQEANASEQPIFMRVEMKAGHSGAQSVSRAAEQDADMWSFLFDQLKVNS